MKCPQCSFAGKPEAFLNGCPSCGYLRGGSTSGSDKSTEPDLLDAAGLTSPEDAVDEPFLGPEAPRYQVGTGTRRSGRRESRAMSRTAFGLLMVGLVSILIVLLVLYFRL